MDDLLLPLDWQEAQDLILYLQRNRTNNDTEQIEKKLRAIMEEIRQNDSSK